MVYFPTLLCLADEFLDPLWTQTGAHPCLPYDTGLRGPLSPPGGNETSETTTVFVDPNKTSTVPSSPSVFCPHELSLLGEVGADGGWVGGAGHPAVVSVVVYESGPSPDPRKTGALKRPGGPLYRQETCLESLNPSWTGHTPRLATPRRSAVPWDRSSSTTRPHVG